jgi:hypothetical protein
MAYCGGGMQLPPNLTRYPSVVRMMIESSMAKLHPQFTDCGATEA